MYSREIDDGIASTDLLEELTRGADQSATQVLARTVCKDVLDLESTDGLKSLDNDTLLELSLFRVDPSGCESCDDVLALGIVAGGE